jgi:hypothetical protein
MASIQRRLTQQAYKPAPRAVHAKGINFSQATIDKIKGMGMTAALKKASRTRLGDFVEGVKRMYGVKSSYSSKNEAC